jgi:predicted transcriptional regulator
MESESLFTSSKWDILKCLEKGKKSPLELANEAKTSVANVSQQLRLLELAGFVKSERVPNREKGLPRILYYLAENFSYLVISSTDFVAKKFMKLQDYQKTILRIWFIENTSLQYYCEKLFWNIEKNLSKIDYIGIDFSDTNNLSVYLLTDNAELKKTLKDLSIEGPHGTKHFVFTYAKDSDIFGLSSKIYTLYDPKSLIRERI